MLQRFWSWILVLALYCGMLEGMDPIQASCNDDIKLPCEIREHKDSYRYIAWYRDKTAIIKRKDNSVTFYNKSSPASLGLKESLLLRQVQPYDSGRYQCFLAADIGGRDVESYVSLNVSECATAGPVWSTTAEPLCHVNVVEIPVLWAVLPYFLFCLIKVSFCFITILVCKKMRGSGRGGRRQQPSSHKYSHYTPVKETRRHTFA